MNFTAPESLVFWTTIIFIVFFILLRKFAWKPILGAVKEREDLINNALESADNARKEMQNLQADNQRILQEARLERDTMLKDAREIKENEAQAQGLKMIEQAKAAIESEKNSAMAELKLQVSSLSIEIAEKLLKDELSNKATQVKLVEKMLGDAKLN